MKDYVPPADRQKLRKQIADAMVRENWIPEAMHLVEQAKSDSNSIQEIFLYEMKVLMHDHNLATHLRHQRLLNLVEKVQNYRLGPVEPIKLIGVI